MSQNDRNLDGTHKSSMIGSQQDQINAGIGHGDSFSNAQSKMLDYEQKQREKNYQKNTLTTSKPVDYSSFSGLSFSSRFFGFLFIVLALYLSFSLVETHEKLNNAKHQASLYSAYVLSPIINLPEEHEKPYMYERVMLDDAKNYLTNEKYVMPELSHQAFNVYHYCEDTYCSRPSTQNLIKYVYPFVKKGKENQQKLLAMFCRVEKEDIELVPNKEGCLISNYEQIKPILMGSQNKFMAQVSTQTNIFYAQIIGALISIIVGFKLLFARKK